MADHDLKRDPIELVILAVLNEEPLYGYALTKQVAARSGGEIKLSPGVLYPMLSLMEKRGLIASTWEVVRSDRSASSLDEPDAGGDEAGSAGRKRKWYRLSAKGRKRLAQRIEAHRAYQSMIESFLSTPCSGEREGAR